MTMLDTTVSNSLQLFQNAGFKVRVVMHDGEPWFVAKDVATCIEHSDTSAMCKLCRDKDKVVASARDFDSDDLSESGNSRITLISESGLYRILAKCNLPKCEPFESWVFDEVLPSIRKTGSYCVNQTQTQSMMCLPQDYESALEALLTEVRKNKALQAELTSEKEAHEKDNNDFKTGLDILNAQKAQISSKREATAMATASSARARQHFAEKVLETHAGELIALRAAMEERRSHLWDADRTAHAIYRLNVLEKDYSLNTLQNKARLLLSHFATKLGKPSIPLPNGATYTDSFGRLQTSVSTYYERDVVDAVLDWVVENPNDFARLGGKRDPLHDEW